MRQNTIRHHDLEMLDSSLSRGDIGAIPISTPKQSEPQIRLVSEPTPTGTGVLNELLFELGIEPTLTLREAAAILRWSYAKTRRYFRGVEGICVCYQPKRYKRAYRTFRIPVSVFAREWQKMTGQQPESAQLIHQRLLAFVK
jgi:hypothetical protein